MMTKKLYSIHSNAQKLDGGSMFGNAPRALWEQWCPTDEHNRIQLACRCLLVHDGDRRILFETGIGSFFSPKYKERYGVQGKEHLLLENLSKIGLSDRDIDVVVLSHLHFDHAGGLLSSWKKNEDLSLLFPNATYLVGELQWQRAISPHPRDKASYIPEIQTLLEKSGRLQLIQSSHHKILGLDYRFHFSDGHTPGLMLTEIKSEQGPILFCSDLIPGRAWVHRSITMGYDRFPEQLIDEKVNLMTKLYRKGGRLFFTHDPHTAMARISLDNQGRFGTTNNQEELIAFPL